MEGQRQRRRHRQTKSTPQIPEMGEEPVPEIKETAGGGSVLINADNSFDYTTKRGSPRIKSKFVDTKYNTRLHVAVKTAAEKKDLGQIRSIKRDLRRADTNIKNADGYLPIEMLIQQYNDKDITPKHFAGAVHLLLDGLEEPIYDGLLQVLMPTYTGDVDATATIYINQVTQAVAETRRRQTR